MECPFCLEEIKDLALACGRCGKDISFLVIREMRSQLDSALVRVEALETMVHTLGAHVDTMETRTKHSHHPAIHGPGLINALAWIALPIFLLMMAHWTIISILDLNPRVLRVASILIPLPFGFRHFGSITGTLWAALLIAAASVTGMLISTSITDHVAILPQSPHEWIETLQYMASIGLAYLVGGLIGWRWLAPKSKASGAGGLTGGIAAILARGTAPPHENRAKLHDRVTMIAGWINAGMVLLTAAGAIYTALGRFWTPS